MDPTEEWFSRSKIRIRNRTVLAALTNKQSNDDGTLSDEEITFLVRRAKGGFGIITSAFTCTGKWSRLARGDGCLRDHQTRIDKISKRSPKSRSIESSSDISWRNACSC